jgi:hypothetical protein
MAADASVRFQATTVDVPDGYSRGVQYTLNICALQGNGEHCEHEQRTVPGIMDCQFCVSAAERLVDMPLEAVCVHGQLVSGMLCCLLNSKQGKL